MLKIAAVGAYCTEQLEQPSDLRGLLLQETGQSFRRINRFIELSLLGALRCRAMAGHIAPRAALFSAAEAPMLTDCVKALRSTIYEQRPPTPFEFMNISGNMAGFYIAQQLQIDGPQLSVARRQAGLECALELLHVPNPAQRQALLGCVEEGVWPMAEQRQRLGLTDDAPLMETSHWFYIDADAGAPLCVIDEVRMLRTREALADALAARNGLIAWQPRITAEERVALPPLQPLDDVEWRGQGTAAEALYRYARGDDMRRWCHVGRGGDGFYYLIGASRPEA